MKMFVKKALVKKVIKSEAVRQTAKFAIKLVITERFLKEHKYLGKVVKYI
jgi:hypothetical protein